MGAARFAVATIAVTPSRAASRVPGAGRSPRTRAAPVAARSAAVEGFRTIARTGCPCSRSVRTTRLPSCPVAPTARIMTASSARSRAFSTVASLVPSSRRTLDLAPPSVELRGVSTTTDPGAHGERIAAAYLTDAGLRVLDRNWRCRDGELDIVARDGDALVFCEVKTRRAVGFGHPVEAVGHVK